MKKYIKPAGLIAACLILSVVTVAQKAKDIFSSQVPLVYLGIDFTQTKIIGEAVSPYEIKSRYFPGINDVVVYESKKYDWQKTLGRTNISSDLSLVTERNAKIMEDDIRAANSADYKRLSTADIERMVTEYDFAGKKGIAIIIFMEAFSKEKKEGAMYVTFADMDSKKMLHTERMTGAAQGFGFRNYYVHCVLDVMRDIQRIKASEWRAKFSAQ